MDNRRPTDVYIKLQQQIFTENKVYDSRSDTLLQSFTLLCSSCFSKEQIVCQLQNIINKIEKDSFNISFSVEYSMIYYLSKEYKMSLSKELATFIKTECIDTISFERFPISNRALIAYFLNKANTNSKKLDIKIESLYKEAIDLLESGDYLAAIDGFFATEKIEDKYLKKIEYEISNNKDFLNREKIAKLTLKFMEWESRESQKLLMLLEDTLKIDLKSWIEPDIQFSLIESEKLINSNLSQEVVNDILDTLKKSGEPWTNIINEFSDRGVVVDLKSFHQMSNFSPSEDTWSYLALEAGQHTTKYELNEEEYLQYSKLVKINKTNKIASYKGSLTLCISLLIQGIGLTVFLFLNWANILNSIRNIKTTITSPSTGQEWIDIFFNPLIIAILIVIWMIRVFKFYKENKDIGVKQVFMSLPIIRFLVSKLLGGELDK